MHNQILRAFTLLLCVSTGFACASEEDLSIDLRTDYIPGVEFSDVRIQFQQAGRLRDEWHSVTSGDYVQGQRIAHFRGVDRGSVELFVELFRPDGQVLSDRPVSLFFSGPRSVTILLGHECEEIICAPGLACSGARCVDPMCTPETPEFCGDDGCDNDPCPSLAACAAGICTSEGSCLYETIAESCSSDEFCHVQDGCLPRVRGTDAGTPDAGARDAGTLDVGGLDAGLPDAAMDASIDPTCGEACSTGNVCERGVVDCSSGEPRCETAGPVGGAVCRMSRDVCDAEERCDGVSTECPQDRARAAGQVCSPGDECDITERCDGTNDACPLDRFEEVGTPCAGGFCNAAHECSSSCIPGASCDPSNPCRTGRVDCSTSTPRCIENGNTPFGSDCRADEMTSGTCGGFSDTCDTMGSRVVTTRSFECRSGSCVGTNTTTDADCSRATNGNNCGSAAATCSDQDTCFDGSCRPNDEPNGTFCGSSVENDCTGRDTCSGGTCQPNHRAGATCNDGDACTVGDTCSGTGTCNAGTPMNCDDGRSCTTDSCSAGVCQNPIASGRCLIGGNCYSTGQPFNSCFECSPSTSQTAFTQQPMGSFCHDLPVATHCEGTCTGSGSCNAPEYPFCN